MFMCVPSLSLISTFVLSTFICVRSLIYALYHFFKLDAIYELKNKTTKLQFRRVLSTYETKYWADPR